MSVGQICTNAVTIISPQDSVQKAALRMQQHKVGSLLILNDAQQPIGVLTDRDIVTRVVSVGKNPSTTLVKDVMTQHPMTIHEDAPIETALEMMQSGGFRRLPVVRDFEHLVGIISLDDVLRSLADELTKVGDLVGQRSRQSR